MAKPRERAASTHVIELWATDEVKPYELNPRKRTKRAIKIVADSIREFGFKQPIVVDKRGIIVAGHGRHLAAQQLGLAQVPVIVAKDLTAAKIKAYRIADNRTAEESDWDLNLLPLQLGDLDKLGFDLSLTGFTMAELGRMNIQGDDERADEVPPIPKTPVSKPGDLWVLGDHRLLCGDATNATDVGRVENGSTPFIMVTDPPYGVEYDPDWRNRVERPDGRVYGAKATGKLRGDKPNPVGPVGVAPARSIGVFENDDRVDWGQAVDLFRGDIAYVWCASWYLPEAGSYLSRAGFERRSLIIWAKQHFTITRAHYQWRHELCWYCVRKGKSAKWIGGRKQTTLWEIANRSAFGGEKDDADTVHGTQKPTEVMQRPIRNHGERGDLVYDPFVGSGTTIIAAERAERRCLALDIDPGYVDVAVERWENYTGGKAKCEHGS